MIEILKIIKQLQDTNSRNEKEQILNANKNNGFLKDILQFVYDPFIVTGISKKKISKRITQQPTYEIINILHLMKYLTENNTGKDIDVANIQQYINTRDSAELQEFVKQVATKSLIIGCDAKTLNKVFGKDFINIFNVMLAEPFEKFYSDIACEVKIDGTRALTIKQGNCVNMFTRNGKAIEGFDDLIEQIKMLPIDTVVLDGELIGKDYTDTMNKLFRKSTGKQANYMIFDMLSLNEFRQGKSNADYYTRKQGLINLFDNLNDRDAYSNLICIKPLEILNNATINDIDRVTLKAVNMGFEGILIKPLSSMYECKRSYSWQKAKPFFSDEFPIIDFEEGDGKYKGTLGKVIVSVNGVSVGVGSGWTDEQRNEIWNNKDYYLGKYVEVQYQEKIEKTGSLRFPTAKGLRLDK